MIKIGVVNGDVIEAGGVKNVTNNYYGKEVAQDNNNDLCLSGVLDTAEAKELWDKAANKTNKSRGPRKKFLFALDSCDTKENVAVRNREKQRLCDYFSQHCLKSRKLVCTKDDTLNKTILCFLLKWMEKGLTTEEPSGGAVFRFLTGDCGIVSEVQEKAYSNHVKEWIKDKNGYDTEVMLMVKDAFK